MTDPTRDQETAAGLAQWAGRIVDSFVREYRSELAELPAAISQGLLVEATVAYLVSNFRVEPIDPDPGWYSLNWRDEIRPHLYPDVAGAVTRYRGSVAKLPGRLT